MKQLLAFGNKEWMEQRRTGRFRILFLLFVIFGILSPALAKLTPWLFDLLSGSMAEQGIVLKQMEATALMSWQQYYKNISLMLIVLVVLFSGVLTAEYQKGTLVNILTKGLPRWKVLAAKAGVQLMVWTICHWTAFGITYAYNVYFWDNANVSHWLFGGACIYLLGIWLISLIHLGSAFCASNMAVILFTGGVTSACFLAGSFPPLSRYLPTRLLDAGHLLNGAAAVGDFRPPCLAAAGSGIVFWALAAALLNKRRI